MLDQQCTYIATNFTYIVIGFASDAKMVLRIEEWHFDSGLFETSYQTYSSMFFGLMRDDFLNENYLILRKSCFGKM